MWALIQHYWWIPVGVIILFGIERGADRRAKEEHAHREGHCLDHYCSICRDRIDDEF